MDTVISNKYSDVFNSLDIEVSKRLKGEYDVDEIVSTFKNFFFNKMFLDITAIKDYKDLSNLQKLSMNINMDKVILKVAKYFQSILLIIIFGLIFLRAKEMMPRFVDMVDKLMNGRILLSAMNLAYYPVTLIGQKVDLSLIALDNQYYALDNGFVYILIHYGILGSLIIAGFQQKAIMKCIEKKDVVLTTICILILFWMVYEGMMVSATSNFTLLFAGTLIGTDKLKQKE